MQPGDRTQVRWVVLGYLFLISVVTYLDRINIAVAGEPMSEALGLSDVEFGTIFSAFVLGYALFQVPGGWLGDRFGHKKILTFVLIWWSFFTALTPWAGRGFLVSLVGLLPALCILRFLVGVGEAAAYPCANALAGHWFPVQERGRATGVIFSGIGVGSTVTPPFIAWLMLSFSWEISFYVCGVIGIVLGLFFVSYVTEWPQEHSHVSSAELQYIREPTEDKNSLPPGEREKRESWRRLLSARNVWLLALSYGLVGYTVYIYFAWFYRYLIDDRGLDTMVASLFAVFPFLGMAVGSPLGGWLSDYLIPRLGKTKARRTIAMAGLLPGLPLIFLAATVGNDYLAVFCFSLAFGLLTSTISCYWATAIEILPTRAGTAAAIMNMGMNLVGAISPILTPLIKDQYGWVTAWTVAGLFSLGAGLLWKFIECGGKEE